MMKRMVSLLAVLALAAVCLLIADGGIERLLPGMGRYGENISVEDSETAVATHQKEAAEIKQVLPMEDGAVVVLYTDGKVRVSGNSDYSATASGWSKISHLYQSRYSVLGDGPILAGLTENGEVVTTAGNPPGWSNVKDLYFAGQGLVGVTHGGMVLTYGDWEADFFFRKLTDVVALANVGEEWGCLKKMAVLCLITGTI